MERQKYNKLILETLSKLIDKYPDLRFGQILVDCEIIKYEPSVLCEGQREDILVIDPFYEESEITLNRMMRSKIISREYN